MFFCEKNKKKQKILYKKLFLCLYDVDATKNQTLVFVRSITSFVTNLQPLSIDPQRT